MNKALMLFTVLFLLIFIYFFSFTAKISDTAIDTDEGVECVAQANVPDEYTVREYLGKIGIFKDAAAEPEYVINVFVFTLPEADRIMLKEGFTVGKNMLCSVIEDYSG